MCEDRPIPTYAYDPEWHEERERLAGIERLWDPGSRALLERLGVAPGWRCLDVGAGGGAMAEWLAGRAGHVVAADISTRFLEPLERLGVEVLELDVLADPLPDEGFDLVYSRFVAEHLGEDAVRRMAAAVRPGGLLVLEDFDWRAAVMDPPDDTFQRVLDAVTGLMAKGGFDPFFGRRLPNLLARVGLEGVAAEGRSRLARGGSEDVAFYRLSLAALRAPAVAAGLLTEDEAEHAAALVDEPGVVMSSPVVVSGWGRKPAG